MPRKRADRDADERRSVDSPADETDTGEIAEVVVVPIEDALDLHPFAPRDIPSVVESYLEAAVEAGFVEVRLIHGRGRGVQRARVRSLLEWHPLVSSFRDAPPERGGHGATIARLKRPEPGGAPVPGGAAEPSDEI